MEKNSEELVSRLSYEIIKELAPDELDLFDDIKEEFFKNPDAFLEEDPKKREKMLGFALPVGAEQFITGLVLPVVLNVITKHITTLTSKKLEEKLDSLKIKDLKNYAFDNAISIGMDKEIAKHMTDFLIKNLLRL